MSQAAVELREYRPGDGFILACNLRDQDRAELDACGHPCHYHAVRESVRRSQWVRTATVDGRVAAIVGLSAGGTLLAPFGIPWMLGTPLVPAHRRTLARLAPRYIHGMLQQYPVLRNLVHADNTVAVQWLRHVGFTLGETIHHPVTGAPFHLFEMTRHVHATAERGDGPFVSL